MAKILFTKINSQWGIITNPVAGNVFRHTIDFPDATDEASFITLRNQFINEQLFGNGETFQDLFLQTKDQAFIRLNETQIEFNYALDTDPLSRDFKELLNSDYMVLEYLIDGVKHYEFYAIIPLERAGTDTGTFSFKGELDIFLSFYITYRNQNIILKTHTDRYDGVDYLNVDNLVIESGLEIEPSYVETREEVNFLTIDVEAQASTIKWMIVYQKVLNNTGTAFTTAFDENVDPNLIELGYRIYITPIFNKVSSGGNEQWYYFDNDINNQLGNKTYNLLYDDSVTISIQYLSNPPFDSTILSALSQGVVNGGVGINFIKGANFDKHLEYDSMKEAFFVKDLTTMPFSPFSKDLTIFNLPVLTTFLEPKQILNEAKLQFSQFTKYFIKTVNGEHGEIPIEFASSSQRKLRFQYGYQPDKFIQLVYFPTELGSENRFEKYGAITTDIIELPLATEPWDEYVTTFRTSSKTGYLSAGVRTAAGISAAILIPGGVAAKGAGAILGVSGISSYVDNISRKSDIKNQPLKTKDVTNSFQTDWLIGGDDKVYMERKVLEDSYKKIVYDYLYKFGYGVNILKNIDLIKLTRYYFNHIEALDVFSNINGKLSSVIKQLIDESFKNGITFWHYRDKETWKGINAYELENQEMSLIPESNIIQLLTAEDFYDYFNETLGTRFYIKDIVSDDYMRSDERNATNNRVEFTPTQQGTFSIENYQGELQINTQRGSGQFINKPLANVFLSMNSSTTGVSRHFNIFVNTNNDNIILQPLNDDNVVYLERQFDDTDPQPYAGTTESIIEFEIEFVILSKSIRKVQGKVQGNETKNRSLF